MRVPDPNTGLHTAALWLCFDLKVTVCPGASLLEYESVYQAFDIFPLQEPTVERL